MERHLVTFELKISRERGESLAQAATHKILGFKLVSETRRGPITSPEFHEAMKGAPILRRIDDSTFWLRHHSGIPWLSVHYDQSGAGSVVLSLSYLHYRFPEVALDAFDVGLSLAESLDADLREDIGDRKITRANIDSLLDVNGPYVAHLVNVWEVSRQNTDKDGGAPLEIPIGPVEGVSDYFLFHIVPSRTVELSSLQQSLNWRIVKDSAMVSNGRVVAFMLADPNGHPTTKVFQRPDGIFQVHPYYWQLPFSLSAAATLRAVEALAAIVGGAVKFNGVEFSKALAGEIHSRSQGLGVEFYQWWHSRS